MRTLWSVSLCNLILARLTEILIKTVTHAMQVSQLGASTAE